jgi:magnesium transporter
VGVVVRSRRGPSIRATVHQRQEAVALLGGPTGACRIRSQTSVGPAPPRARHGDATSEASVDICVVTPTGVRPLSTEAAVTTVESGTNVVWIDLSHQESDSMRLVVDLVHARQVDVDDCSNRLPVPKLHAYADHYYSAINGLARGTDGRLYFQPLKIFFNANLLITVMGPTSEALTPDAVHGDLAAIRRRIEARELRPSSAFDLVTAIRLQMLRSQEALVADVAARAAELEKSVMGIDPVKAETVLNDLFSLRHDLQTVRTNAAQTHELYVHLIDVLDSEQELMALDKRRLNDLRLGFSHLRNTVDLEREYLQEVLDLLQTRVSTELNRFVRKITAWGTIGIAWTVIVGIYGMNFDDIPGLEWRFGYAIAFGLMAVVGLVLGGLFRRRGWL